LFDLNASAFHQWRLNVQGYLLELLFPTGWRRPGTIYWRFTDAESAARQSLSKNAARGARVMPVRILPDAVLELTAERQEVAHGS
jgi:hypothetical protein